MEYNKPALNVKKQIELLKFRNLIVEDYTYAELILSNITYYRLSSYMKFFQINDEFKANTTFEKIIDLYNFDKELRSLIFENIRLVEISLRTKICLHMCTNYGTHWFNNEDNFKNEKSYLTTLDILNNEKALQKDTFIKYYTNKYSEPKMPPFWMFTEVLSMGDLSKILDSLNFKDLKQISRNLTPDYYTAPVLTNWIHVLATIRNICAHHSRLWNRELKIKFSRPQKIVQWDLNKVILDKVYAVCFVLSILLKHHPCSNFDEDLISLLKKHPNIDITCMGFPDNWTGFQK